MASLTVDQLQVLITADTADLRKGLNDTKSQLSGLSKSAQSTGSSFSNFAGNASAGLNSVADAIGGVLKKGAILAAAGSFGIGAAAKASWDQVSAVQQATVALNAYEKDGKKVNAVLSDLVAYARSDMGVLFNRKDLFASAQSLKIMGDNTGQLTNHVKILSRSVGLGLSSWDDLNQIVGRVGSTGRLTGIDFDNLTKAGYKLDPAMRNTNVTFDSLFKALDKGIPADAMAGQANTIVGLGVRLQTAFRGIGDAILGVDADSGQFVNGGLGSKLVGLMQELTQVMKDPAIKKGFADLGQQLGDMAVKFLPILVSGISTLLQNMDKVILAIGALSAAFVVLKSAAMVMQLIAIANPYVLAAAAIAALVVAVIWLEARYRVFSKTLKDLKPIIDPIVASFKKMFEIISIQLAPAIQFISDHIEGFKKILMVLIGVALVPLIAYIATLVGTWLVLVAVFMVVSTVVRAVAGFIVNAFQAVVTWLTSAYNTIVGVITSVITFIQPALSFFKDLFVIYFGMMFLIVTSVMSAIWNNIVTIWNAVYGAISSIVQKIIDFFAPAFNWLKDKGKAIIDGLVDGIKSVGGAVASAGRWIADKVTGIFANPAKWLYNAGKSIIEGLVNGIKDKVGDAVKAASEVADKIESAVRSKLKINSPSKVFAEIGHGVGEGMALGIDKSSGLASASASNLLGDYTSPSLSAGSIGSLGGGGGYNREYNINQITISSEVDGERWLRRLTGDQEITEARLTPKQAYM